MTRIFQLLLVNLILALAGGCARGPNAGHAVELSPDEVGALISRGDAGGSSPAPRLEELDRAAAALGFDGDPDASFIVRMGRLTAFLDELSLGERPEQIADWVVHATMIRGELEPGQIRDLTFDRPPLRDPALLELSSFDHGPGRRLVLDDGRCWLFLSASDPQPIATVARMADLVRMEQGEAPAAFTIFVYRSDLFRGHIHVRRLGDLPRDQLFSERFGYVEAVVTNAAELGDALERIDDLSHVARRGQGIVVGGRRFEGARTPSVTLEDVAVLYQGSRGAGEYQDLDDQEARIVEAHNRMVALLNQAVAQRRPVEPQTFERHMRELAAATEQPYVQSRAQGSLNDQASAFQAIAGGVQLSLDAIRARAQQLLSRPPPTSPGFSLDPQWDLVGLTADLERLITDPASLVTLAHELATDGGIDAWSQGAARPAQQGAELARQIPADDADRFADLVRSRLPMVRSFLDQLRTIPAQTMPELPQFEQLREAVRASGGDEGAALDLALELIQSRNQIQCARYDGSIRGTRVAMNLFYTDLVAKLWAGIDLQGSAPTEAITGFLSVPTLEEQLEEVETPELNRTRIWFGPRMDRIAWGSDGTTLHFAHVASRVYAASSASANPGQEAEAVGSSRQVLGWWDRHFAQVAEYEPQFHLQNQIMKWSVVAAWLSRERLLGDLGGASFESSLRFDRWLASEPDLRMGATVSLLPEARWRGGTECLNRLASRVINQGPGRRSLIHGGVSLGSRRTLDATHRVSPEVPPALRRSGNSHEIRDGAHLIESGARVRSELPPPEAGGREARAQIAVSPEAREAARTVGRAPEGELRVSADQHAVTTFEVRTPDRMVRLEGQRVEDDVALAPRIARPDEARAPPTDAAFDDLFRAVIGDGADLPRLMTAERVRTLDPEQLSTLRRTASERGHEVVNDYIDVQTGAAGASPEVAGSAALVREGDRVHLRVRLEPADLTVYDESRPLLYTGHNAARRGGHTDIFPRTSEVGADIYTSTAGVAHQADLDAFPLGRAGGAVPLADPSAVQILNLSTRVLGRARPTEIQVADSVYQASGSIGPRAEAPEMPPKRRIYLVGAFMRGR